MNTDFHRINLESVKSVAEFFGKSVSWIYAHKEEIGAVKIGGSWFFPSKEEIYERLFRQTPKSLEIRLCDKRSKISKPLLQNKEKGNGCRIQKERGGEKSETIEEGLKRLGFC